MRFIDDDFDELERDFVGSPKAKRRFREQLRERHREHRLAERKAWKARQRKALDRRLDVHLISGADADFGGYDGADWH